MVSYPEPRVAAPPRILVTHGHTRIGFNVAASLTAAGYGVISATRYRPGMCAGMRGVAAEIHYPDPFTDGEAFVAALTGAARSFGVAAVLPVHEEIFAASLARDEIERVAPLLAPAFTDLIGLQDKARLADLAGRADVLTPASALITSPGDVMIALRSVGLPAVIKPRFGSGARGVRRIAGAADFEARRAELERATGHGEFIAQAWVPGRGVAIGGVFSEGRVVALTGHMRLREIPISGGTSTARVTFRHPGLEQATARLFAAARFSGVGMAEFRYDPSADRAWLLEINPRYWGGIGTAIASGVPIPVLHLRALLSNEPPTDVIVPTRMVESRWLLGEVRAGVELLRAGRWRDVAAMLRRPHGRPLVWDDLAARRWSAFAAEARAYLRTYWDYRNLGGHSAQKDRFFLSRAS